MATKGLHKLEVTRWKFPAGESGFRVADERAAYVEIDGVGMEIFKEPKTDNGVKKSARGLLRVDAVDGVLQLTDRATKEEAAGGNHF